MAADSVLSVVQCSSADLTTGASLAYVEFILAIVGIYCWEFLGTLWFDWSVLMQRVKFRWSYIPYFGCRYLMWGELISLMINLNSNSVDPARCKATIYSVMMVLGNLISVLASTNFCIRSIAIWSNNRYIAVLLTVISLAHWAIAISSGLSIEVAWNTQDSTCQVVKMDVRLLGVFYLYTAFFDLLILIIGTIGLLRSRTERRSKLWKLVFQQGLLYFLISLLFNISPAVAILVNGMMVWRISSAMAAGCASAIASNRMILTLVKHAKRKCDSPDGAPRMCLGSCSACCTPRSIPDPTGVELTSRFDVEVTGGGLTVPSWPPRGYGSKLQESQEKDSESVMQRASPVIFVSSFPHTPVESMEHERRARSMEM